MKKLTLFLWVAILCTSCSTPKFLTSDVKAVDITEMLKIEPFSYISLIEKGNKSVFNDSISNNTKVVLNESVETFRDKLRLSSEEIILTDSLDRAELEEELRILMTAADRNQSVQNIAITPLIDSLLNANGKRFGLIIVQSGFTRTKGNYGGQIVKGIGIGILTGLLTGISYQQIPVKASTTLYAMIVDSQNKNVAFYNKSFLQDAEPTKKEVIIKQLNNVFRLNGQN